MVETAHAPNEARSQGPRSTERPSQRESAEADRRIERRRRLRVAAGVTAATVAGVAVAVVVVRARSARRQAVIVERVPPSLVTAWRTYELIRDHAARRAA